MNLRQLEVFAAVMTTGSVTGAARLLAKSQPATSRLVQELEAEIGYALFTRHGPRVTPTTAACQLHEDAERALAGLRQVHLRAAAIARGEPQPLWVVATSALAVGLLPQALFAVQNASGPAPVQLRSASPEQVVQAVLGGTAQLGLCSLPLEHRGLELHWAGRISCVAVLAAADPLARRRTVPLAALAQRRLITMSNPYRLRHRLDIELARLGATTPQPALIETNSSMNALALVRAGLGVAVLEPLTLQGAPLDGVIARAIDVEIPFHFGAITARAAAPKAAVQALIAAAFEAATRLRGFVPVDSAKPTKTLTQTRTLTKPRKPMQARQARPAPRQAAAA
ncbi:MAG: LysR family transcriptional regulator [Pseudomonadota bacterium]|nr:LysR family transcriptional regulator [Pseudomonadota bacterium]